MQSACIQYFFPTTLRQTNAFEFRQRTPSYSLSLSFAACISLSRFLLLLPPMLLLLMLQPSRDCYERLLISCAPRLSLSLNFPPAHPSVSHSPPPAADLLLSTRKLLPLLLLPSSCNLTQSAAEIERERKMLLPPSLLTKRDSSVFHLIAVPLFRATLHTRWRRQRGYSR